MNISTHSFFQVLRSLIVWVVGFSTTPVIYSFLSTIAENNNLINVDEINMRSVVMNKYDIIIFPIQLNSK